MDIDIDFQTTFDPRNLMRQAVPASMIKNNDLVKHNCGHYFQTIPIDRETGYAAIPYEEAEVLGYFKIDFLHLSVLDKFSSKQEMRSLLNKEPNWELLQDPEHVSKLFHIHRYVDLLADVRPTSVQELADCLALIRPGKKRLLQRYLRNPADPETRKLLYIKEEGGYSFKRSHAISYALTIVLQLHLIAQGKL